MISTHIHTRHEAIHGDAPIDRILEDQDQATHAHTQAGRQAGRQAGTQRTFGEGLRVDAGLAEVDEDAEGLRVEARVEQRRHLVQGCVLGGR